MPGGQPTLSAEAGYTPAPRPPLVGLAAAFAAVYLVWGCTYLAIRYAVEALPPLLMVGTRCLVAGLLFYGWARLRSGARPTPAQWRAAAVVGALLFLGGQGPLAWAEQQVPSGAAAVLFATLPLWMAAMEAWVRRTRPDGRILAALVAGLLGVGLLVGPGALAGGAGVAALGGSVVLLGALSWSAGSVLSRRIARHRSNALATGMYLLAGSAALWIAGLAAGEARGFDPAAVPARAWLSLLYLTFLGSVVAFGAYAWLLRVSSVARVATYAYVNPVVALLVGWGLGGEEMSPRLAAAAALVIGAVVVVLAAPDRAGSPAARRPGGDRSIARRSAWALEKGEKG